MVDLPTVCCMCGDVGFAEKLFRCHKCQFRFQHSYCSNYYDQGPSASAMAEVCDWCQSEERSARGSRRSAGKEAGGAGRSEYSGDRIKQGEREDAPAAAGGDRGKTGSGTPSPRPAGRRYKLLKDVLC